MKKLFTMMAVCLCGTMAYAQSTSAISAKDVTIAKGGTSQMEVVINDAANNTAFQFDLKLPAGVSVKEAVMKGPEVKSRVLQNKQVDKTNNIYRFLSYDNGNAKLTSDGDGVLITLVAEAEAETGKISINGDNNLVVNPEGTSTPQAAGDLAGVTVADGIEIEIPWGGKTTFVCAKDLDFSSVSNVKAYIVTGYDVAEGSIWLTRVNDVPANTPIWVSGPKGENSSSPATKVTIPEGTSTTYYPQNLLIGSATESIDIPAATDEYMNWTIGKDGEVAKRESGITGFPAGKAYLHLAKKITSVVGEAKSVNLTAKGNKLAYVSPCDLDFTDVDGLKAYVVTGYAKDGTIWLSRVKKVSANTPLYLKGGEASYSGIPSTATQMQLVNMLKGDATNTSEVKSNDGTYTAYVLSKQEGAFALLGKDYDAFPAGVAYLLLPNSHLTAQSRGEKAISYKEVEAEVIKVSLKGLEGDGETTGISRVAAEAAGNDTWYNLSGQRISTPTRKGLYIKNGKKIVVK